MGWKNDQVSEGETKRILDLARKCLGFDGSEVVMGNFVELGCYRGDTSLLLAEVLREYNRRGICGEAGDGCEKVVENFKKKRLWIYDSFEGLPEKSAMDESVLGEDFKSGELMVTKREVKERFLRAGLPVPVIKKGWFAELESDDLPERIAFAFLDGDFYESIRDSLRLVGPRMSNGGVIMVHDYTNPALPGVARAVDEWMRGRKCKVEKFESLAICRDFGDMGVEDWDKRKVEWGTRKNL